MGRMNKQRKPAAASLNAPRPMQSVAAERKKRKKNRDDLDATTEIELEQRSKPKGKKKKKKKSSGSGLHRHVGSDNVLEEQYSFKEVDAGQMLAAHLSAQRKHVQFNKVVKIGRVN